MREFGTQWLGGRTSLGKEVSSLILIREKDGQKYK